MASAEQNGPVGLLSGAAAHTNGSRDLTEVHDRPNEAITTAATVGAVAVGAALFEAALLPGIAIGVAAVLAPKYLPKIGEALAPMFRSSVRGMYVLGRKTREIVADAKEQVGDIIAEVEAEDHTRKPTAKSTTDVPPG